MIFRNLKYIFLFTIFTLLLLEVGTRILNFEQKRLIHDRHRAIAPYVSFTARPGEYDHNSQGYRGKLLKETSDFDIVFIGASTLYHGDPPLPEIIEKILNLKTKKRINVYNFGISSSKSSEELARLTHQILDHRPNMVISYHGGNEIELSGADPRVDTPFNHYIMEQNPLMTNSPKSLTTGPLLLMRSAFVTTFFSKYLHEKVLGIRKLKNQILKGPGKRKKRSEKAALHLMNNIEKMQKISNAFNIDYLSIMHPLRVQSKNNYNGLWFGIPSLRKQINKNKHLPITSLIDFYSSNESCFIDHSHIYQKCKESLAIEISAIILKRISQSKALSL